MTRIGKLAVGSLVGVALTLGMSGVAVAAPVSSTTTGSTSTTTGSTPTTTPSQTGKSKPQALTGREIWRIVRPHHAIDCAHASAQLKRVQRADAAAAKRLGRWQAKNGVDQKSQGTHAARLLKQSTGKVKGFQKLEQDGQALMARIDAKCGVSSSSK
jgi:hypothetical protein